jgi:hypothetical protein
MRIDNTHVQLALYGIRPEHQPRNVARAIVDRKAGTELLRRQLEARQLKAVSMVVALHADECAAAGVTP